MTFEVGTELGKLISVFLLLFVLVVAGILRKNFRSIISESFSISFNLNLISRFTENSNLVYKRILRMMLLLYCLSVSMIFYYLLYGKFVLYVTDYFKGFLVIFVATLVYKWLKMRIYLWIGNLTGHKKEGLIYYYSDYFLSSSVAMIIIFPVLLFPFVTGWLYSILLYFSLIVMSFFYLLRIYYGVKLIFGKMPLLHFLLLILTLEMFPVLIGIKILSNF